jgi:DNA-binding MltR family transcriptional regulator
LESLTIDALVNVCKYPDILDKKLVRGNGPLSSFSARIDLLMAFGDISDKAYKDLHLIRKIRNSFAHDLALDRFDQDPILSWCNALKLPKLRSSAGTYETLLNDHRTLFIVSAALCDGELRRMSHNQSIQPTTDSGG